MTLTVTAAAAEAPAQPRPETPEGEFSGDHRTEQRCAAEWREINHAQIPAARAAAEAIARERGLEVTFHEHEGKQPTDDLLFGARFCGPAADTYFAGREFAKAVIDTIEQD